MRFRPVYEAAIIDTSIMDKLRVDAGFTITEVIVAIIVMSLFLVLFFQLLFTSESQRLKVTQLAAANDIAHSNLRKITAKSQVALIAPGAACDNSTSGSSNPNNGILYKGLDVNSGSVLITEPDGNSLTPEWSAANNTDIPVKEPLVNTSLPTTTVQRLLVSYPRGCNSLMPAKIISIVSYDSESVVHAAYVN